MNHPYAQSSSLQPPAQHSGINLSPIAESFLTQSPATPSTNSYAVGRGPFNPTANNPTLDDLKRYIVKFTVPGEQSCKVNIGDCPGGVEILDKVLRKLNKDSARSLSFERATLEGGGLAMDGWSVYMSPEEGGNGEPLSESEILSICRASHHPIREHGLILRRTQRKRNDELLQPPSMSKATKRASSISILSGLGVADPEKALDPPSPTASSIANQYTSKKPSRLRNFFGQRPPSELITNHLTEYFPFTEKKVLERTARNSMMHRRESTASWNNTLASRFSSSTQGSIGKGRTSPRDSVYSFALPPPVPEKTLNTSSDIPRVSLSTDDGRSVDLPMDETMPSPSYLSAPQLLPPIPFPTESLSQSLGEITGDRSRRASTQSNPPTRMNSMTELRSKKDRSDTASLMTVDEITASVESRRESLAIDRMAIDSNTNTEIDEWTKVDSEDEDGVLADEEELEVEVEVGETEVNLPSSDDADDDIGGAEEDEEKEVEDEEDEEIGKTMTSEGHKWIKGALIGSGSFGKVYLGMDASTGLLMAVKQVELPSGSSANEERKQNMLSALEREIELLKDLQHENIVQYLYSSADEEHLNIFLEYVPGGSVSALLRNYGAFEETLVKNFVRQILLGLQYLHDRDIIHRDIKGGNILVDNKGGIKISDFGISKKADTLMSGNRAHRPSLQGSVFWMAPEVVKQSGHTSKADIWSVGCLVVEMLTGEHPWAQLTQMQAIFKIGSLAKPTIPSDVSSDAQDFLEKTFDLDVNARPSTSELLLHTWIAKKPSKGLTSKSP
jgi:mitogen-activated protein kinase kinase kinase